jgi:hypothetical protein
MKVKFKREGGFAGMTLRREADQHELPPEARHALDHLKTVRPKAQGQPSTRRDGFVYTIEFESDHVPIVVAIDEEQVSHELAPLIHFFESTS